MHSGLQNGGTPMYSGKQVHEGEPFASLHIEFGPQGDGKHGLLGITKIGVSAKKHKGSFVANKNYSGAYVTVDTSQKDLLYIWQGSCI